MTLESLGAGKLRTGYIAIGNARRNAAGEITNAVVINSYYSGDSTDMYEQWVKGAALSGGVPIIGPGRPIDTDRYYVIMVDPLGTWGASKPSDGLGIKFPQYSYYDMVQANYRLLRDELKVARVALVTGVSMGGTQTYVWGVMHPEYIGALMPIGGTTQSDGEDPVGNWTFQMMTAAIEGDPVWQATKGDYYNLPKEKHPMPGVAFGWSILGMTGYDFGFRTTQNWAAVQPEIFYWDPPNEKAGLSVTNRAKLYDAVDLVWRNRVGETHNINPYLGRIQSRTLVMHITNDLWLNFKLAQKAVDRVPGRGPDRAGEPGRPLRRVPDHQPAQERSEVRRLHGRRRGSRSREDVRRQELSRTGGRRKHRSKQVLLEGLRDLSVSGQIRQRQGQDRQHLADRLHG
ncbi:homoserine acetyltransferase [Bradyrhizobium sp. i1.4.4]